MCEMCEMKALKAVPTEYQRLSSEGLELEVWESLRSKLFHGF